MNKLTVLFFVFFSTTFSFARDVQENFLQANNFYKNKKYEEAFDLYDSFENKGPAVWQNMGNCSFKMNKQVEALVYWRRAENSATEEEKIDIRNNISTAHEILGYEPEKDSLWIYVKSKVSRFSLFFLQLLFLFMWFMLFGFIFIFKKYKKILFGLLIPINFILGLALLIKHIDTLYTQVIVVEKNVSLFSGPDKNYHVVSAVNCADEFDVLSNRKDWIKVKRRGLVGWILANKIKII